jgi:membrane protein implicated in regulation of membrane protease activity
MALNLYMKEFCQKHFLSIIYLVGSCLVIASTISKGLERTFFGLIILFVVGKIFYVAGDLLRFRKISLIRAKRLYGTTIIIIVLLIFGIFEKVIFQGTMGIFSMDNVWGLVLLPFAVFGVGFLIINIVKFILLNLKFKKEEQATEAEQTTVDQIKPECEDVVFKIQPEKEKVEVRESFLRLVKESSNKVGHLPVKPL